MRLFFWSAREVGLDEHSAFFGWLTKFIGNYIGIYERKAMCYADESAEWSVDPENIKKYSNDGKIMNGVVGIGRNFGYRGYPFFYKGVPKPGEE